MILTKEEQEGVKYINFERCKRCGGICCMMSACDCSPYDFDCNISEMRKALLSGYYSLDFARLTAAAFVRQGTYLTLSISEILQNKHEAFYIHPKNGFNRPIVDIIHDSSDNKPCCLYSYKTGCELPYEKRPKGGRLKVPTLDLKCPSSYTRDVLVEEWRPFKEQLFNFAKEFFNPNWRVYKKFRFIL